MTRKEYVKVLKKNKEETIKKNLKTISDLTGGYEWTVKEVAILNEISVHVVKRIAEQDPILKCRSRSDKRKLKIRPDLLKTISNLKEVRNCIIRNDLIKEYLANGKHSVGVIKTIATQNNTSEYVVRQTLASIDFNEDVSYDATVERKGCISLEIEMLYIELDENIKKDLKLLKRITKTPVYSLIEVAKINSTNIGRVRRIVESTPELKERGNVTIKVASNGGADVKKVKDKIEEDIIYYLKLKKPEVKTFLYSYSEISLIVNETERAIKLIADRYRLRDQEIVPGYLRESLKYRLKETKPLTNSKMYSINELSVIYGLTPKVIKLFSENL